MTRKEMKRILSLNGVKMPNKNLRDFFSKYQQNRKWIPDHLRNEDGSHVFCNYEIKMQTVR